MRGLIVISRLGVVLFVGFMLTGCIGSLTRRLGDWAKDLADKETYPIIEQKRIEALGEARAFTIDKESDELTDYVLRSAGKAPDEFTTEGLTITLTDTLSLAMYNSRQYQSQKEALYRSALGLTAERYRFSPIFSGSISAAATRSPGGPDFPTRSGSITTRLALSQLFATGARLSVSLTNSFTRFYTGDPRESATGSFTASIIQPLLRGGGMRVTLENLKQAERDVIYQVRSFARFEKGFFVDRLNEYFGLLEQLDAVENERKSVLSRTLSRERSEALAEAGNTRFFEAAQARISELQAEDRLNRTRTRFVQSLDRFKINLGLPTDLNLMPDKADLDRLVEQGLIPIGITLGEAVDLALEHRLDYLTSQQEVEDAERRLYIAANSLLPNLDFSASVRVPDEGQNQPLSFDTRERTTSAGVDLELPLSRKNERNAYRRSEISLEATKRNLAQLRDQITQEVRTQYQNIQQAETSYRIQLQSVEISELRLSEIEIREEAGLVTVREVIDSQDDLLGSRNSLTSALIDYLFARLDFLIAIEVLEIDEEGMWFERQDPSPVGNISATGGS